MKCIQRWAVIYFGIDIQWYICKNLDISVPICEFWPAWKCSFMSVCWRGQMKTCRGVSMRWKHGGAWSLCCHENRSFVTVIWPDCAVNGKRFVVFRHFKAHSLRQGELLQQIHLWKYTSCVLLTPLSVTYFLSRSLSFGSSIKWPPSS